MKRKVKANNNLSVMRDVVCDRWEQARRDRDLPAMFLFCYFFLYDAIISLFVRTVRALQWPDNVVHVTYTVLFVVLLCMALFYQRSRPLGDLVVFYVGILLLFGITWLLCPSLRIFFARNIFGVKESVFAVHRGIYAYLIIRLLRQAENLWLSLKVTASVGIIFRVMQFIAAQVRGFWLVMSPEGGYIKHDYQLGYGYDVMYLFFVFLLWGILEKNHVAKGLAALSFVLLFMGGSRGAFVFCVIGSVLFLYVYFYRLRRKRAIKITTIVLLVTIVVFVGLILLLPKLFPTWSVSSRTLASLLSGNLFYDNGRFAIWKQVLTQSLHRYFLPGGAFADRPAVVDINIAGYSHSIIVEHIADFGLILGLLILLIVAYMEFRMLFTCRNKWRLACFFVFIASSLALLSSFTFWNYAPYWACLGMMVSSFKADEVDLPRLQKPIAFWQKITIRSYRRWVKRLLDIVLAVIGLVLLAPIYLVLAIMVRVKLGTPVLFKQYRPGKDEQPFRLIKFRTMTDDRDETGKLLPNEMRLTPFGHSLRRLSLDEIPELLNILKGDMSFVGPRPLRMRYLPYYYECERKRHDVRPGLTGWAQVQGRNKLDWDRRFECDVYYVEHLTFSLDLSIILETIVKVFARSDIELNAMDDLDVCRAKQRAVVPIRGVDVYD